MKKPIYVSAWLPWLVTPANLPEIRAAWRDPSAALDKLLGYLSRHDGRIHLRLNDPWDEETLMVISDTTLEYDVTLACLIPVLDPSDRKLDGFCATLRMLVEEGRFGTDVIAESVFSKSVDDVKGGDKAVRVERLVKAFKAARLVSGFDLVLAGTELAQSTADRHADYTPFADWRLAQEACAAVGVKFEGIVQAFSMKRMGEGTALIGEAATAAHALGCWFAVTCINDETGPESFRSHLVAQAQEVAPFVDRLGLTVWSRGIAVPSAEWYWGNCLAVLKALKAPPVRPEVQP